MQGAELMLVQPAIGGDDKKQVEALMEMLAPHVSGASDDGSHRVWIEKSVLHSIARKAPGITPSYYFKWCGEESEPIEQSTINPQETLSQNQESFVSFLVKRCALLDRVQAHVFLQAFRQAGLEWIAHQKRTIDFGWFRIVPMPLRVNWKETLYSIEEAFVNQHTPPPKRLVPKLWLRMLKQRKDDRDKWFEQQRTDCFLDTKLLDMHHGEHFARWHLNIVEGSEYRDYVKRVETDERRKHGPVKYTQSVIRQISSRCGAALDILSTWVAQIAGPCGAVERKRGDSQQILVPYKKPDAFMALRPVPPVLPVVVDDSPEFVSPEALDAVAEKTEDGLCKMLYLQSN